MLVRHTHMCLKANRNKNKNERHWQLVLFELPRMPELKDGICFARKCLRHFVSQRIRILLAHLHFRDVRP